MMKVYLKPTTKLSESMDFFVEKVPFGEGVALELNDVVSMTWIEHIKSWDIYFLFNGMWKEVPGKIERNDVIRILG